VIPRVGEVVDLERGLELGHAFVFAITTCGSRKGAVVSQSQIEDDDEKERRSHVVALHDRPWSDLDRPAIKGTRGRNCCFIVSCCFVVLLWFPEMTLLENLGRLLFVLRSPLFLGSVGAFRVASSGEEVYGGGNLLGIGDASLDAAVVAETRTIHIVVLIQLREAQGPTERDDGSIVLTDFYAKGGTVVELLCKAIHFGPTGKGFGFQIDLSLALSGGC